MLTAKKILIAGCRILVDIALYISFALLLPTALRAETPIVLSDIILGDGALPRHIEDRSDIPGAPIYSHAVYMPMVLSALGPASSPPTCELNEEEAQMAALLTGAPDQQRANISCNPLLAEVARSRAADMAARGYFGHVNPDGIGPNHLAEEGGYQLPESYDHSLTGNNIESIGAGTADVDTMWQGWMASEHHASHLLGQVAFFQEQTEYGIGFVRQAGSPYQFYWVVLIAKPAR
jgi:uncharacterized protein YkwD